MWPEVKTADQAHVQGGVERRLGCGPKANIRLNISPAEHCVLWPEVTTADQAHVQAAAGLHGMDSPNVTSLASQLPEGILADVIG